jgi:hypothetical protein
MRPIVIFREATLQTPAQGHGRRPASASRRIGSPFSTRHGTPVSLESKSRPGSGIRIVAMVFSLLV